MKALEDGVDPGGLWSTPFYRERQMGIALSTALDLGDSPPLRPI